MWLRPFLNWCCPAGSGNLSHMISDGQALRPVLCGFLFLLTAATPLLGDVGEPREVAPGVWFHEGDLVRRAHSNSGWIALKDGVFVVEANYPSGAEDVLPKIRRTVPGPIRYAFDTHHHGDHAYGNRVWADQGATIVAHEGVLRAMQQFETGYFGGGPGRWEGEAKVRPDVARSRLTLPTLLFSERLVLDDGQRRVELLHLGVAHTRGDGFVWLPKERVLFTGDACVNGPYNNAGDGSVVAWPDTLRSAMALKPRIVCPGHGLVGGPELLEHQLAFVEGVRNEVKSFVDTGADMIAVRKALPAIREHLRRDEGVRNLVGDNLSGMVEKVFQELTRH